VKSIAQIDLFAAIENCLKNLPDLNEEYYKKFLLYKPFRFDSEKVEELAELLAGIHHILVHHKDKHYMLLEKRILEAQDAIIEACETLYSERIRYNPKLKDLVVNTIVPYYYGRFQIGFSREISFLPLELRLYIYMEILRTESSSLRQMHLMDRIALTLHKADERFLGDCAIFISAWLKYKMCKETTGKLFAFAKCLETEMNNVANATKLRTRILKEAEMTPEDASREFWYGYKSFSSLQSIHNVEAAKICLELFCSYYEGNFSLCRELKSVIIEYYKTRNETKIQELINNQGLDEIVLKSRYVSFSYSDSGIQEELGTIHTDQINNVQRDYVKEVMVSPKENQYLYINSNKRPVDKDSFIYPEEISQKDATRYLEKMMQVIKNRRINLYEFNELLSQLTSSIMGSRDWDIKIQNIVIGSLGELYSIVWLRNKAEQKDIASLLKALINILSNKGNIVHKGQGWPICLIMKESKADDKPCVIFYSKKSSFPEFVGQFYVGVNPSTLGTGFLEDSVRSIRNIRCYWQRIEKSFNDSRATSRKRAQFWRVIKEAREKELQI
jgi:hypothetical protein